MHRLDPAPIDHVRTSPTLPEPRGEVSAWLIDFLRGEVDPGPAPSPSVAPAGDEDQTLALYVIHELSYRGWAEVPAALEDDPTVHRVRRVLEERFEAALADLVAPMKVEHHRVAEVLRELVAKGEGPSLTGWCAEHGDHRHVREQAILRSPYQLKEADPHSWALPRLEGEPKAALVEIQFDEYGNGKRLDMHNELFALHLERLGLDSRYGAHLDAVPGIALALTNLVSMFGMHRRWLGALVGHLALFEMASVPVMASSARTLRRLGYDDWTCLFFDTHVVADAEHQTVAADRLAQGLAHQQPDHANQIVFGARCLQALEAEHARTVIAAWERNRSSLLRPECAEPTGVIPGLVEPVPLGLDPRRA